MKRILKITLIVIAIVLFLLIVGPFLVPVPALEGVKPPTQLGDTDSRFIRVNNLAVHYKVDGQQSQTTFVLLHGFAASVFSWREIMRPLGEYGAVIAYDRPGFGLTSRPMPGEWFDDSPYGIDAQVELVIGMLDKFGVRKAVLVGNSAGGNIAALTAIRHPDRVQELILVDPAIYTNSSPPWYLPLMTTPQGRHVGPLIARQIKDWGIDFAKSAWHDPTKITPEIMAGYTKPLQAENWDRGLWEYTAASKPNDVPNQLKKIGVPTLVITGDDDRIVPTKQSIQLARDLPNAQLVVIPNCGHVPQEECPIEFMHAVKSFLDKPQPE